MNKQQQPEPDRLIEIKGFDWSDYSCVGKWVLYKKPQRGGRPGRFMRRCLDGTFEVDRDAWICRENWEYVDEPKQVSVRDVPVNRQSSQRMSSSAEQLHESPGPTPAGGPGAIL